MVYTLTLNNEGGMNQDPTSDTRAPMVYTLTLNNEGDMDQDPTHTTEWLIYDRIYIMSQLIYSRCT